LETDDRHRTTDSPFSLDLTLGCLVQMLKSQQGIWAAFR